MAKSDAKWHTAHISIGVVNPKIEEILDMRQTPVTTNGNGVNVIAVSRDDWEGQNRFHSEAVYGIAVKPEDRATVEEILHQIKRDVKVEILTRDGELAFYPYIAVTEEGAKILNEVEDTFKDLSKPIGFGKRIPIEKIQRSAYDHKDGTRRGVLCTERGIPFRLVFAKERDSNGRLNVVLDEATGEKVKRFGGLSFWEVEMVYDPKTGKTDANATLYKQRTVQVGEDGEGLAYCEVMKNGNPVIKKFRDIAGNADLKKTNLDLMAEELEANTGQLFRVLCLVEERDRGQQSSSSQAPQPRRKRVFGDVGQLGASIGERVNA